MYKRARRDTLTGGTKDVNPQFMHLTAVQSGADATTTTAFPIPIQRLQNAGRAQVMEILKVAWYMPIAAEVDSSIQGALTTSSFGTTAVNYGNTRIIDYLQQAKAITTSGTFDDMWPIWHDLTDGAGHGILVGTDNIFIQIVSVASSATNTVYAKILYRWKDVSTVEYVGIVQGQQ